MCGCRINLRFSKKIKMLDEHKKTLALMAAVTVVLLVAFWSSAGGGTLDFLGFLTGRVQQEGQISKPRMTINSKKDYKAIIKTDKGEIRIDLFEKDASITVNNFVYLANENYFDGSLFHRVIQGFIIQGGVPAGEISGGPGYTMDLEENNHLMEKGIIATATDDSKQSGSQFFIITKESQPHLQGENTVFGRVIEGMDVVSRIENVSVKDNGAGEESLPVNDVVIDDIEIIIE